MLCNRLHCQGLQRRFVTLGRLHALNYADAMSDGANGSRLPTIGEVAAGAGVSRATVSRAFTQPHRLSARTVARVHEVAGQLGYVPNLNARALRTGRQGAVALVVPDIANPFFPPLIRGAQARADQAGFSVLIGDSEENADKEDVLVAKLAPQTDGFVIVSSRMSDAQIRSHATRRPVVLINRDIEGLPRVLIDTASGIADAVSHLAGLGHRHVVYVGGPSASWSNQQRKQAIRRAGRRLGVKVTAGPAQLSTYDAGRDSAAALVESGATAAVAFDDLLAQGILAGLAHLGVKVPDEFSVVGCDDVLGATTYPPLTTVSAQCAEAGRSAVEILLTLLAHDETRAAAPAERRVQETRLVIRATTATAPPHRTVSGPRRTRRTSDS